MKPELHPEESHFQLPLRNANGDVYFLCDFEEPKVLKELEIINYNEAHVKRNSEHYCVMGLFSNTEMQLQVFFMQVPVYVPNPTHEDTIKFNAFPMLPKERTKWIVYATPYNEQEPKMLFTRDTFREALRELVEDLRLIGHKYVKPVHHIVKN